MLLVASSSVFPFLKLPFEIRVMIYELVLVSPWKKLFYGRTAFPIAYEGIDSPLHEVRYQTLEMNLLRTSEAVYEEAWPIILQKSDLVIGYGELFCDRAMVPERFIQHIKTVELHLDQAELVGDYGHYELVKQSETVVALEDTLRPFRVHFENTQNSARRYRLEAIHERYLVNLGRTWTGKLKRVAQFLPETWILDVTFCYCYHSCCRLAHDAIGRFCAALDRNYKINPEAYQGYTPKFQIVGLRKWEEDAA